MTAAVNAAVALIDVRSRPLTKFSELRFPAPFDSPVHYQGVGPMSSWLILLFIAVTLIAVVLDLGRR